MSMKICYGCFHEINDTAGVCPFCGADSGLRNESKYPNALPCGYVLIDKYVIGHVLGQGGFGITYIAKDMASGSLVAVKEYFPDTMASRNASLRVHPYNKQRSENFVYGRERFLEEAKTLAEFISSPNIVGVLSLFEDNGTAYYVMEYLKGTSFKSYLQSKGGKISWEEAYRILSPVMDALSVVHAKGIIHRDVTPDNIAITEDGTVKLLDFGAARYSIGEQSKSLDVILKHGFAPYEQYMRHSRQGPFTDVYSLAASFYCAITGEIPPESVERLDDDTLKAPSELGISIPAKAEAALLKALAVRSSDRFQTVDEFKYAILHGSRTRDENRRRMTIAAGAALLLAAIPVIFWLVRRRPAPGPEPDRTAVSGTASTENQSASSRAADSRSELEILTEKAEKGDAASQVSLANMYYSGEGAEKDPEKAFAWYTRAAEQGNAAARYLLAYMYQHGEGTEQNYKEALNWYSKAAEQGSPEAGYQTGYIYEHGIETERDYARAFEYYTMSAEQGYADAQYSLGNLYLQGKGTDKDRKKALEWYTKAAEKGNINAQYSAGMIHEAEKEYAEALSWYQKAAEEDYPAAQNSLGRLYKYGYGVDQDDETAFKWFEKAASHDYADAQYNMGMAYYDGSWVGQDYEKALEWYQKAADQGYAPAQNNLAWMYAQGEGTDQDNEKAVEWFEKAADQGHAPAQNNLGYIYMEGIIGNPDYAEARKWFEKAAEQGYGAASFSLGEIYLMGLGVDADREEAKKWYEKAVDQGYEEAKTRLDSL